MPLEIERKYLVVGDSWRSSKRREVFRQGYLSVDPSRSVRVRVTGESAKLTIKGVSEGIKRTEFEYPIPKCEAEEMLSGLCLRPLIDKTRYFIDFKGLEWSVDEFHGLNEGLILAEVELASIDQQVLAPDWIGQEVSEDPRYYNAYLVNHPFSSWE